MTTQHPLLTELAEHANKVHNGVLPDKHTFMDRVKELGLEAKQNTYRVIVKYPETMRNRTEPWIMNSRGTIWNVEKMSVLCRSIRGSYSFEQFQELVPWDKVVVEQCMDGTLLNIYWNVDKWSMSTKFDMDAKSCFKSSRSFRELFEDIIDFDVLTERLDKNYTYSFLLVHKDNRQVTPIDNNEVFHIETTHNRTGETLFCDVGIPHMRIIYSQSIHPDENYNFGSYEKLKQYVEEVLPWYFPGAMCWSLDRKYRCYISNPRFEYVKQLLGNQSDIRYVILQIVSQKYDDESERWNEIIKYYPEYRVIRQEVEASLDSYIHQLYDYYVSVKILKNHIALDSRYGGPMQDIHRHYIEQKKNNPYFSIREPNVRQIVMAYDTPYLFSLLFK